MEHFEDVHAMRLMVEERTQFGNLLLTFLDSMDEMLAAIPESERDEFMTSSKRMLLEICKKHKQMSD